MIRIYVVTIVAAVLLPSASPLRAQDTASFSAHVGHQSVRHEFAPLPGMVICNRRRPSAADSAAIIFEAMHGGDSPREHAAFYERQVTAAYDSAGIPLFLAIASSEVIADSVLTRVFSVRFSGSTRGGERLEGLVLMPTGRGPDSTRPPTVVRQTRHVLDSTEISPATAFAKELKRNSCFRDSSAP